ncbi:prolipoprotein diacylglyceryl transferase [Roseivivax lentus]|nr:hypothetical protein [Roseivivax lentus]
MKDETKPNFSLHKPRATGTSGDVPELPEACLVMAGWHNGEDWEPPSDWGAFPLREICPDAASYFAQAGHFTARDLRNIVDLMEIEVDPKDAVAVYDAILDRAEEHPWILPVLESSVSARRGTGRSRSKAERRKITRSFQKMPLMKLGIAHQPTLHDRVAEVLSPPVPADVAVALFCEYVAHAYWRRTEDIGFDQLYREARDILRNHDQVSAFETLFDNVVEIDDARIYATCLLDVFEQQSEMSSVRIQRHAIRALEAFSATLHPGSPREDFEIIATLANRAADHATRIAAALQEALVQECGKLGLEIDFEALPDQARDLLCRLSAEGMLDDLIACRVTAKELDAKVSELRRDIAQATENDDFDRMAELAPAAKEGKAELEDLTRFLGTADTVLRKIIAGEILSLEDLPEDMRPTTFAEAPEDADPDAEINPQDAPGRPADAPRTDAGSGPNAAGASDAPIAGAITADAADAAVDGPTPSETDAAEADNPDLEDPDGAGSESAPAPAAAGPRTEDAPNDDTAAGEPLSNGETPLTDAATDESGETTTTAGAVSSSEPSETRSDPVAPAPARPDPATDNAAPAEPDTPERPVQSAPVPETVLADLVARDLVGIAADAADAFEAAHHAWPIEASVLRVAAASRAPMREYGPDTQRFLELANTALSNEPGETSSVMMLGALIRPAIFEKASGLRSRLSQLTRGPLGQHLLESTEAIADLEFDFPPHADELARLSGARREPAKTRLARQLATWCETSSRKTSRWGLATGVMHEAASDAGLIGAASAAITSGAADARQKAQVAIDALSYPSDIEAAASAYSAGLGKNLPLRPKAIEYLHRQFNEPLGLLSAWIRADEREGKHSHRSADRARDTLRNLQSRLEKAARALAAESAKDGIEAAVAGWIATRIEETLTALAGGDVEGFSSLEAALTSERDLMPAPLRNAIETYQGAFEAVCADLVDPGIPSLEEALRRACDDGAYEAALRLAERSGALGADAIIDKARAHATALAPDLEERQRRLKVIARVDTSRQRQIATDLEWCEEAQARLDTIIAGEGLHDLSDITRRLGEIDAVSTSIEEEIRNDQTTRIAQYRTEHNSAEADKVLGMLDTLTIEAIEENIAQLRDGRSAAGVEVDLSGMTSEFTPHFLEIAVSKDWPSSAGRMEAALAAPGQLAVAEDRRAAAAGFIETYRDIMRGLKVKNPPVARIRELFEEIGFETPKIHEMKAIGRTRSRLANMSGRIHSDGWFLPPVFGSRVTTGYQLAIVASDTLPEAVIGAIDPGKPTILLLEGVADFARRAEYAQRLRAKSIPALLIDEALIVFTATHRETRARTVFECGLPYGRVEPYITDAATVPPEMFFGREEEILQIMSRTSDGCLVYGGRQLGKSALLNHIVTTRHDAEAKRIVVKREVKPLGKSEETSEIWSQHLNGMLSGLEIVKPTSRTPEEISRDIKGWLNKYPGAQIVCMFDEADNFLAKDTKDDYPELSRIKELMESTGRAFKVVFAGLHNVQRMYRQPNSPLAHLGKPICIGPLNHTEDDKRAAHDLVVAPMRAAGFRFESREDVEKVLAWANYYPSLVQEYGKGLLASLHGSGSGKNYQLPEGDGPLWTIPGDMLFKHRGFTTIEARIRQKFHWTLDLDPRYALVAYTLARLRAEGREQEALHSGFTAKELLEEALAFWPETSERPSQAGFEALLEELFDLGVLGRVPIPRTTRYRYLLRTRQVAAMLGEQEEIDQQLLEIYERDPVDYYDRALHRKRYSPSASSSMTLFDMPYSPLTDLQTERLVSADEAPVQIICGLSPLGLGKVGVALKRLSEAGRLLGARNTVIPVHAIANQKDLRTRVDAPNPGKTMTLLIRSPGSAKEAEEEITWLERQQAVLDKRVRPVIILDAADPDMRELAHRRSDQAQYLAAWGVEMVRAHLNQVEKTDLDTRDLRKAILAASGGIPSEVLKLVKAMARAEDPAAEAVRWKVDERFPEIFLKGPLVQALQLFTLDENADIGTLDELLRDHLGTDLETLGPDLAATGLILGWSTRSGKLVCSALGWLVNRLASG